MKRAALGVSAHLGWAATCVLSIERGAPRVLRSDRIETAAPGDREAKEPYHVAGGFDGLDRVPQPTNPKAALERGLRKQRKGAAQALDLLARSLAEQESQIAYAGILVSRGRPAATLEKAIGSHTQIHIQEGIAVRESLRRALEHAGARVCELDQKSVEVIASEQLARPARELLAALSATRPENGGAWRKEEKLAALAAWVAWARGGRR